MNWSDFWYGFGIMCLVVSIIGLAVHDIKNRE